MKTSFQICALVLMCGFVSPAASATLRYVNINSATPTAPYTNWATAATVIQDAIDVALPGDEVVVTNGVYETGGRAVHDAATNRVAVIKTVTVRSVNGPETTVIRGYQVPGTTHGDAAVRCVYLTNGAALIGFTVTEGATPWFGQGGGVLCESTNAFVSNCVLSGNSAHAAGGGSYDGTIDNCAIVGNSAHTGGGAYAGALINSTLASNLALSRYPASDFPVFASSSEGAAAYSSVLIGCTLSSNTSWGNGGGVAWSALVRCKLIGNSAHGFGGGGANFSGLENCSLIENSTSGSGGATYSCWLNNCFLTANTAAFGGGAFGGSGNNCTITGNTARNQAGGVLGVASGGGWCEEHVCGAYGGAFNNCIVYYNDAPVAPNFNPETIFNYSCTTPLPPSGVGNITNAPLFIDPAAGNFRLQSNSPCINAGRNAAAPAGPDLDGNPRIVGGTVDIGAYEFQSPQSTLSYAWLQHYGLPTDGSADSADTDGDGCNNWQEWRAGTEPTNSLSVLRLLSPMLSSGGLVVRWQSVTDRTYRLERTTNLTQGSFEAIASNIVGQAGATAYMDTSAATNRPLFYRLRVEE